MTIQVKFTEAALLALLTVLGTFGAGFSIAKQQQKPEQANTSSHKGQLVCLNPIDIAKVAKKQRG